MLSEIEVGLDLAEKEWLAIGQLDDREITTRSGLFILYISMKLRRANSLGKRLLMVLSPYGALASTMHLKWLTSMDSLSTYITGHPNARAARD